MAKLGSLLTTFVMAIPLAAVPFMAVYGVPELRVIAEKLAQAKSAGDETDADDVQLADAGFADASDPFENAPSWGSETQTPPQQPLNNTTMLSRQQQFGQPVQQAGAQKNGHRNSVTPVGFESQNSMASNQFGQNQNTNAAPGFGQAMTRTDGTQANFQATASSGNQLTWQAATAQLNNLGIRNFRLEPGRNANEFLFVCFYSPENNPRMTMRFEAESTEPLKAVELVLGQVQRAFAL